MTDWLGTDDDAVAHVFNTRIRVLKQSNAILLDELRANRTKRIWAFLAGAVTFFALGFTAGAAWSQGHYTCEPPDRIPIEDDGPTKAMVTFYNSVNDCSEIMDLVMQSDNGIAVRVIIQIGSQENDYRETIMLEPQDPLMMAFPPEGDLIDGEEMQFVIQGGIS